MEEILKTKAIKAERENAGTILASLVATKGFDQCFNYSASAASNTPQPTTRQGM